MPLLNFIRPFTLRREDGSTNNYVAGYNEVAPEDAEHWFVKAHTYDPPNMPPPIEVDRGPPTEVTILKPFTLRRNDGSMLNYRPGTYDMPKEDAEHWFTIAHSDHAPEPVHPIGTPEYAMEQQKKIARQGLIDAAIEQEAGNAQIDARDKARTKSKRPPAPSGDEKIAEAEQHAAEEGKSRGSDVHG